MVGEHGCGKPCDETVLLKFKDFMQVVLLWNWKLCMMCARGAILFTPFVVRLNCCSASPWCTDKAACDMKVVHILTGNLKMQYKCDTCPGIFENCLKGPWKSMLCLQKYYESCHWFVLVRTKRQAQIIWFSEILRLTVIRFYSIGQLLFIYLCAFRCKILLYTRAHHQS